MSCGEGQMGGRGGGEGQTAAVCARAIARAARRGARGAAGAALRQGTPAEGGEHGGGARVRTFSTKILRLGFASLAAMVLE